MDYFNFNVYSSGSTIGLGGDQVGGHSRDLVRYTSLLPFADLVFAD
jgi:hypothetical protein